MKRIDSQLPATASVARRLAEPHASSRYRAWGPRGGESYCGNSVDYRALRRQELTI